MVSFVEVAYAVVTPIAHFGEVTFVLDALVVLRGAALSLGGYPPVAVRVRVTVDRCTVVSPDEALGTSPAVLVTLAKIENLHADAAHCLHSCCPN